MSLRKIAIGSSVAVLSLAAVPIAQAASTPHPKPPAQVRVDRSRDMTGRHVDKLRDASRDTRSVDISRDLLDR